MIGVDTTSIYSTTSTRELVQFVASHFQKNFDNS